MNIVSTIEKALERSKELYREVLQEKDFDISRIISFIGYEEEAVNGLRASFSSARRTFKNEENILVEMDNKRALAYLINNMKMQEKVQLIYMDPPFFTGNKQLARNSNKELQIAYDDTWESKEEYLTSIAVAIRLARELLTNTGTFWVHLDWRAVHEVKLMMDVIFGEENFVNEIIWSYKSGGAGKKSFAKKHDTILFYKNGNEMKFTLPKEKSYNRGLKKYCFKNVEEYCDEKGWYTLVNMRDVWDIDMVGRTSKERVGYASQKPEALLKRIIESCTDEGDLVCDIYAGSGTTAAVAGELGRKFIAIDSSSLAVGKMLKRFIESNLEFSFFPKEEKCVENRKFAWENIEYAVSLSETEAGAYIPQIVYDMGTSKKDIKKKRDMGSTEDMLYHEGTYDRNMLMKALAGKKALLMDMQGDRLLEVF